MEKGGIGPKKLIDAETFAPEEGKTGFGKNIYYIERILAFDLYSQGRRLLFCVDRINVNGLLVLERIKLQLM